MIIDQPSDLDGEVAWLDCEHGHRARHPLIYPDIVHRVVRSTADPKIPVRELYEWTPQWISLRSVPGQQPVPVYHDWTESSPVQWSREWPALVAAQRRWDEIHDEMNRLGRRGVDTSMSGIAEGLWGFDGRNDSNITLLAAEVPA
jgi:hypothetical protein